MKKYQFKCRLISDVVLTSVAATEGFHPSLDYIPGGKFLGIAAGKLYNNSATNRQAILDMFHNGTVRFGDALPFVNGEKALRAPFSWFKAKGDTSDKIYLHHKLEPIQRQLRENKIQLKQYREGFFTPSGKLLSFDQTFSLKSAYDEQSRKSKDGQMFGYFALRAGTNWVFEVEDDAGSYIDVIRPILVGRHRIGRSKSAEYGLIDITFEDELPHSPANVVGSPVLLYAESNLCFYDNGGRTTAQPTAHQLTGLPGASIDWALSQVRTRNYQTWNGRRDNKDADRIIIERGSVFYVNLPKNQPLNPVFFSRGIGAHRAEGFGKVLLNPDFLTSETHYLTKTFTTENTTTRPKPPVAVQESSDDGRLLAAIGQRYRRSQFPSQVEQEVQKFKGIHGATFKGITNSQWGTLRNYAKNLPDYKAFHTMVFLKDNNTGFMYRGKSENDWAMKDRRTILEKYIADEFIKKSLTDSVLPFIVRLCNQMPKPNQQTNESSN